MEFRSFLRSQFDDVTESFDGGLTGSLRTAFDRLRSTLAPVTDASWADLGAYARHLGRYLRFQNALMQYRYVMGLLLGVRLGVFQALADRRRTADALAADLDADPDAVDTLLAAYESRDLVESTRRGYALTPFAADFLAPDPSTSERPFLRLLGEYADAFPELEEAVRTARQPPRFDIREDGPAVDTFLDAVNSYMDRASRELLTRADLPNVDHFIAGSMGVSFSANLLRRHRDARVTYGCLDHLVRRIPNLRDQYGVDPDRVLETHAHAGEPADDQWGREAFDLVFLTKKMILDPQNRTGEKFARKAYSVLEPGGAAVFWEAFHGRDGDTPEGVALESLFDLGVTPEAGPLYRDAFAEQLHWIGFDEVDFLDCLGGSVSFAVARRRS